MECSALLSYQLLLGQNFRETAPVVSQTLDFLLPVRIGDQINVVAEVIKKHDKENIIELKTDIYNQNKQIVTKGIAKVKVIEPEAVTQTAEEKNSVSRVALIVGGTGGIGKATCLQLSKDGFDVIIHYNKNRIAAEEIKSTIEKTEREGNHRRGRHSE